jgi:hypothetical protein
MIPWLTDRPDPADSAMLMHPAVIDAIAECPMNKHGQFNIAAFFETVERFAKKNDAE